MSGEAFALNFSFKFPSKFRKLHTKPYTMPRVAPKSKAKKAKSSTGKDGAKERKVRKSIQYKPVKSRREDGSSRRWRPGTVALREIRHMQKGTNLLIQKAPFQRLIREVMDKHKQDMRFRPSALEAIQEATEQYLISVFEGAVILQLHRKKKTLIQKDLSYTVRIRGDVL